ncbi:MAG: hypothetical protein ABJN84_09570 [Flavobacteriaceae bacterium]
MSHYFENLPEKISLVYGLLASTLFSQFRSEDSIISREAQGVLQNPEDKEQIDKAVQEMKKDSSITRKKLTLSNNKEIIISID